MSDYFVEPIASENGKVHIWVNLPEANIAPEALSLVPHETVSKFNRQTRAEDVKSGGRPWIPFHIDRSRLIDALLETLVDVKFVFVHSPGVTGKSTLCAKLNERLITSGVLVAHLSADEKPGDITFSQWFYSEFDYSLEAFCELHLPRALLIDEAQTTYIETPLWSGLMKTACEKKFPNLLIILFATYGCFYQNKRPATPEMIPILNTFTLKGTSFNVGLQISRAELDDMAGRSIERPVLDFVYHLSSGHIGVAATILRFLRNLWKFANHEFGSFGIGDFIGELRSVALMEAVRNSCRDLPTIQDFQAMVEIHRASLGAKRMMVKILNHVALHEVMLTDDAPEGPEKTFAIDLLTKQGYLYLAEGNQLHFASYMHLKSWQSHPIEYMDDDVWHTDFLVAAISRMDGQQLRRIAAENPTGIVRERQIQHELYGAAKSCAPPSWLVDPEHLVIDGKGYVDLMIRGEGFIWLWELLVDGDRALEHERRFQRGGKYFSEMEENVGYALVDFRQSRGVRHQKPNFAYVSFADDYTNAKLWGMGKKETLIELIGVGPTLPRKRHFLKSH